MDRTCSKAPAAGLTLMELIITLSIVVTLVTMAAPPMRALIDANQLRNEAHRLMAALNLARSESVLRNEPVSLCPSAMSSTGIPVCAGTYAGGWLVFSNPDKDRVVDENVDEVLRVFPPLPKGYSLTNRDGSRQLTDLISYLPDGSSRANRTLVICPAPRARVESLSIVMNIVGRPRLSRSWGRCAET